MAFGAKLFKLPFLMYVFSMQMLHPTGTLLLILVINAKNKKRRESTSTGYNKWNFRLLHLLSILALAVAVLLPILLSRDLLPCWQIKQAPHTILPSTGYVAELGSLYYDLQSCAYEVLDPSHLVMNLVKT